MIYQRNKFINSSPVNKLISFINHGLIACTLLGINIYSKIEIPAWFLGRDNTKVSMWCNELEPLSSIGGLHVTSWWPCW